MRPSLARLTVPRTNSRARTHTHTQTHTLTHAPTHPRTHPRTHVHTLIHSYTHTLIHAYTHTLIRATLRARRACTRNDAAYMADELVYWVWIGLNKRNENATWKWEDGSDLAIHDRW